jgi:hypothetical protein
MFRINRKKYYNYHETIYAIFRQTIHLCGLILLLNLLLKCRVFSHVIKSNVKMPERQYNYGVTCSYLVLLVIFGESTKIAV